MSLRTLAYLCLITHFQFAFSQFNFACEENFCSTKVGPCVPEDCSNGRIVRNATQCGCCDICVRTLEKDEECFNLELGSIPRTECGPGLMCMNGKCTPANTPCVQDQLSYDKNDGIKELMASPPRPQCDHFGDYQPVICKPGMICFCVDKEGSRIFGTAPSTENATMNCNCSRDFQEFRGKMTREDQFLRCLESGNYDALQCTDSYCYCIGDDGHLDGRPVEVNTTLAALRCYDPERHKNYDKILRSKCWRERDIVEEQIEEYRHQGVTVIGIDLPQCDLDGTFGAVKCKGESCICIKKDGSPIPNVGGSAEFFEVRRGSDMAAEMNCRCAREKELLRFNDHDDRVTQIFSQYKCLQNGNYRPLQCVDSMCFCTDEMGFQENEAVLMHDRQYLDCYDPSYEDDLN